MSWPCLSWICNLCLNDDEIDVLHLRGPPSNHAPHRGVERAKLKRFFTSRQLDIQRHDNIISNQPFPIRLCNIKVERLCHHKSFKPHWGFVNSWLWWKGSTNLTTHKRKTQPHFKHSFFSSPFFVCWLGDSNLEFLSIFSRNMKKNDKLTKGAKCQLVEDN